MIPSSLKEVVRRRIVTPLDRLVPARITINASYLAVSNALQYGLSFVTGVLVARVLGAEELGVYGLASAVGQIAYRLADLGLPIIMTRIIARSGDRVPERFAAVLALRFWTGLASIVAVVGFAWIAGYDLDTHAALLLYAMSQLVAGLRELGSSVYYGLQSMARPATASLVFRMVAVVCTVVLLLLGQGVVWAVVALLLGQAAAAWYLCAGPEESTRRVPASFAWSEVAPVLRQAYPIAIAGIFAMVNLRADAVILSLYVDDKSLGLYNAAYALVIGFALFPTSFLPALFPALSARFAVSRRDAVQLFARSLAVSAGLGLIVAAALSLLGPWIMVLLYGSTFRPGGQILAVLAWAILCMYMSYANSTFFNAVDRQDLNLWTAIIAGTVNVVANLFLVPKHGGLGAAWATVLSEASFVVTTSILTVRLAVGWSKEV